MIWTIYNALLADAVISDLAGDRIDFYEYPEPADIKETHIIIDPLVVPKPGDYADDTWLTDDYMFQIDVWSKDMDERNLIANKIQYFMWKLNFRQIDGMDEYDNEYDIFRDARRYRGKAYRKDFNNL
ncbi:MULTISPECIES: hypothetical protein [unclassified Oceanobacillus]|uniref:hypothetical protein n=1 Tax=unclassified Oceanobacillus TaxID=2630292 RepID=UPI00300DC943